MTTTYVDILRQQLIARLVLAQDVSVDAGTREGAAEEEAEEPIMCVISLVHPSVHSSIHSLICSFFSCPTRSGIMTPPHHTTPHHTTVHCTGSVQINSPSSKGTDGLASRQRRVGEDAGRSVEAARSSSSRGASDQGLSRRRAEYPRCHGVYLVGR